MYSTRQQARAILQSVHQLFSRRNPLTRSDMHSGIGEDAPYTVRRVDVCQRSIKDPAQTIHFQVSVIDSHPQAASADLPTILALHGAPGLGSDFEPLLHRLKDRNVRCIAPTFPGFESSEVESWKLYHLDYSTQGLDSIVKQVLDQIDISRVSMVMCHSAGSWLGYKMATENDWVHSLCLLNPTGARPHRSLRPYFIIQFIAWLFTFKRMYMLLMPLMELAYSVIGFKGVKGGDHLVASMQMVSSVDFHKTKKFAQKIQQARVPLLFAYSQTDKIIEGPVSEEMLFQHLDVPKDAVTLVSASTHQKQLQETADDQKAEAKWQAHVLQFERGGHVVHKAYADIITERILHILTHVHEELSSPTKNRVVQTVS